MSTANANITKNRILISDEGPLSTRSKPTLEDHKTEIEIVTTDLETTLGKADSEDKSDHVTKAGEVIGDLAELTGDIQWELQSRKETKGEENSGHQRIRLDSLLKVQAKWLSIPGGKHKKKAYRDGAAQIDKLIDDWNRNLNEAYSTHEVGLKGKKPFLKSNAKKKFEALDTLGILLKSRKAAHLDYWTQEETHEQWTTFDAYYKARYPKADEAEEAINKELLHYRRKSQMQRQGATRNLLHEVEDEGESTDYVAGATNAYALLIAPALAIPGAKKGLGSAAGATAKALGASKEQQKQVEDKTEDAVAHLSPAERIKSRINTAAKFIKSIYEFIKDKAPKTLIELTDAFLQLGPVQNLIALAESLGDLIAAGGGLVPLLGDIITLALAIKTLRSKKQLQDALGKGKGLQMVETIKIGKQTLGEWTKGKLGRAIKTAWAHITQRLISLIANIATAGAASLVTIPAHLIIGGVEALTKFIKYLYKDDTQGVNRDTAATEILRLAINKHDPDAIAAVKVVVGDEAWETYSQLNRHGKTSEAMQRYEVSSDGAVGSEAKKWKSAMYKALKSY